ncbi:unnamed protein product [Cochlearia groenlandica]
MLMMYGSMHSRGPSQALFCLKQTTTVVDYVHQFEDLASQVTCLDDQKLEGIFLNELTDEMREVVHVMKPQSLA